MKHSYLTSLLLVAVLMLGGSNWLFAQGTIVNGTVYSEDDGQPLIGVTILIEGTSSGAISDIDGNFKVDTKGIQDPVLVFSYTGYITQKVKVGGQSTVKVTLKPDLMQLSEVVVTAFGVESEVKTLNYSIQQVGGKELQSSSQDNVVNALQGKVAGVQITNTSGSPGSGSQIIVRGFTSVNETGNNQPLFVVDGIPIDNSSSFGGGNRAMDINMADVESVSVLKGASAAALYGIDAANGVILITTKSGKSGKTTVDFSNTFSTNTALSTPGRQDMYMQGTQGIFDPETLSNYGPLFISTQPKYDNIGNFLRTGIGNKTDLSIAGGNEKYSTYLSLNYLDQTGIIPGERYDRFGALLKQTVKLGERLNVSTSMNYIRSTNDRNGFGIMNNIYRWPLNDDMRVYLNPDGTKKQLVNFTDNPNWIIENNPKGDEVHRILANTSISYDITPALNLTYKLGGDITNQYYKSITSPGTIGVLGGSIYESDRYYHRINSTALLTYQKTFMERLNLSVMLGNNVQLERGRTTIFRGEDYLNPDLDNINNMKNQFISQGLVRKRMIGNFGEVKLDFDGIYFLSITGRHDQSSSIKDNFFYPSIGGGVNIGELIPSNDILTYMKLRGSYAEVGKDAPAHSATAVLEQAQTINGGFKYDFFAGNPDIMPEFTKAVELGFDSRLFNGKSRVDFSYYRTNSLDQIITTRISPTSGWIILTFNQGSVRNEGYELYLENEMFSNSDFKWNMGFNLSQNITTLIDLPSFVSRLYITSGQVISAAKPSSVVGQPLMGIEGTSYLRNENGELVLDEFGFPRTGNYQKDANGNYIYNSQGYRVVDNTEVSLGNRQPKFIMGLTNDVTWKNFNLSFLVDIRVGGDVINATKAVMVGNGSSEYLEEYLNKEVVFKGVVEQPEGSFTPNDQQVRLTQGYFTGRYATVGENFVEDASWTRLRYVTLNYRVPSAIYSRIKATSMNISVTGRNLLLFTKYSGGDPETNYQGTSIGGSGTAGLDYFNVPAVKGFDVKLNVTF